MTLKAIKPLGNRVLVRRQQAQDSVGGILLPDSAKKESKQGTVVAVGPGLRDEKGILQELRLKAGDEILFQGYSGVEVKSDQGEELILISEDDILGIIS